MRALITGINGFVGGRLARRLTEANWPTAGTVRGGDAPPDLPPLPLFPWDVAQPPFAALIAAVTDFQPDVVFHLAGVSNPAACGREEPTPEAWAANVTGTANVVALLRALPQRPRLVLASSSHVYAPVSAEEPQVTEASPLGPLGAYGKTKAAAEEIVLRAAQTDELDVVIARIFHHTGPGQPPSLLFGELIGQIADPAREQLELQTLNFTLQAGDVRDLVRALIALAERGRTGEAYNIAGTTPRSGHEWIELVRRGTGTTKPLVAGDRVGRPNPAANCDKLLRDTGFRPEVEPESTFRDMLAFELQRLQRT